MDARTELEQEISTSEGLEQKPSALGDADSGAPLPESARESTPRRSIPIVEEASFVVLESGKIRFFVRPRVEVEVPASLEDVQRLSLTLTARSRGNVRRLSIGKKRLPDTRVRERHWAYVDRVSGVADVLSDLGPQRYTTKTLGVRNQTGVIEVASGTYAIASHRDHVHLLYELEPHSVAVSAALLDQLRILPRASYIAAVFNPESRWRVRDREPSDDAPYAEPGASSGLDELGQRKFTPLDPLFLDHEGTELVLIGGGQSQVDQVATWARS